MLCPPGTARYRDLGHAWLHHSSVLPGRGTLDGVRNAARRRAVDDRRKYRSPVGRTRSKESFVSLPPLVEPAESLSIDEVRRYSRHLIIPDVAMDGQKRLKNARVLCIGAGGLGSPTLMYLAAAGVGTIGIVEFDVVDESNLQRQIIHA